MCCNTRPRVPLPSPLAPKRCSAARHSPEGALQRKEHSKSTPGGMPNSSRTCCRNCSMPSGPGRTRILTNWPLSDTTITGSTGCCGLGCDTDLEHAMAARQSGRLPLQNLQLRSSCGSRLQTERLGMWVQVGGAGCGSDGQQGAGRMRCSMGDWGDPS